ncbi:MAG: GIY-YIG nuclease family protein [Fibrobacter sp.]|uniref:GIY-YIG nuclease family protein n=1 Tax=unclassified Fibrobacter TaxID=2634177 RepID=UPI00092228D8|nr:MULTISPECIES: GIY-YIG nuclease family protein [unclassified Fibrobacter]MDD5942515.1 GIY-YIG nuclease family protein [Fibrobacter sp.]MDY6264733.1 GIY-YIG nuclease family protein [Fibrobacter sp.]SHL36392.1 putative endonuclease [Fibrobacter sp. UWH4]
MPSDYYTYIMSNQNNTTIYVGVTNSIERRTLEHIEGVGAIFTSKYKINKLVYFERYTEIKDAIQREKQLKGWRRDKKNSLVNSMNPEWNDLMRG